MKIGIIGSGGVATALAAGFLARGDQVMLGTRDPAKLAAWQKEHPSAQVRSVEQAALFADMAVLAVKGTVAESVLRTAAAQLAGKVVIDTSNPISDAPPVQGVLQYFTGPNESLFERLQRAHPQLRLVKAFNSVGAGLMVQPKLAGGRPTMFIAGDDAAARAEVARVLDDFGWDVDDMGAAAAARAIEPLAMLWCIHGLLRNDWSHALRMQRPE